MSIPQWVIDYNNAGHQSSAGRAVKLLMEELASLREQLKIYQRNTEDQDSTIVYLNEQLKQQEEVIRELIPMAYRAKSGLWANDPYAVHVDEIIEKAKSLTTKDK